MACLFGQIHLPKASTVKVRYVAEPPPMKELVDFLQELLEAKGWDSEGRLKVNVEGRYPD